MRKTKQFPKGFFQKERPSITYEEATKNITPYEWPEEVINGDKKVILYSVNEKESPKQ